MGRDLEGIFDNFDKALKGLDPITRLLVLVLTIVGGGVILITVGLYLISLVAHSVV